MTGRYWVCISRITRLQTWVFAGGLEIVKINSRERLDS